MNRGSAMWIGRLHQNGNTVRALHRRGGQRGSHAGQPKKRAASNSNSSLTACSTVRTPVSSTSVGSSGIS